MKILDKNQLQTIQGGISAHGIGGGTGEGRRTVVNPSLLINLEDIGIRYSGHGIGNGTGERP